MAEATYLCSLMAFCAPNFSESHLCFASDAAPFCQQDSSLLARALSASDDVEKVNASQRRDRPRAAQEYEASGAAAEACAF